MGLFVPAVQMVCERGPLKYFIKLFLFFKVLLWIGSHSKYKFLYFYLERGQIHLIPSPLHLESALHEQKRKARIELTTAIWQNRCFHLQTRRCLSRILEHGLFTALSAVFVFRPYVTRMKWLNWTAFKERDECSEVRKT